MLLVGEDDFVPVQVGFFDNFTQLIQHAVSSNDYEPATIVAHSLGCLVSLSFLTGQPQEWVDKYVDSLVAISAPWAGSATALKGADPRASSFVSIFYIHFHL